MHSEERPPDIIAHRLVTNVGSPARIVLTDETVTVPVEPYRNGTPPTDVIPIESFDALIEDADIVDGGLTLFGINGLHLPASEWERVGLQTHWDDDDADLGSPFFPPQRTLEIRASREDTLYDTDPERYRFDHLESLPQNSPVITEWEENSSSEAPANPPVPFSRPVLSVNTIRAEGVSETRGLNRIEVGTIAAITIIDELDEVPQEPDVETRDIDVSPPRRHPEIDYDELDPLPQERSILASVHAINRHAKRLDADAAYQSQAGAEARSFSLQKKALYKTKTVAVHRLAKADPEATRVELHTLNGEYDMYCFYFPGGFSFHQPVDAAEDALVASVAGDVSLQRKAIDFMASTDTQDLDTTLEQALRTLDEYDLNANTYSMRQQSVITSGDIKSQSRSIVSLIDPDCDTTGSAALTDTEGEPLRGDR